MLPSFIENPNPELYLSDDFVVMDFETTNLDKGSAINPKNRMVLACWKDKDGLHHHFGDTHEQEQLLHTIGLRSFIVCHNSKFELHWLSRVLDISRVLHYDTLLGDYVLNGNRRVPLDLSSCLTRRGLKPKYAPVANLIESGVCPSDIREDALLHYCKTDVEQTYELFIRQREELREQGKLGIQLTRCLLTPVLVDLEQTGLQLDESRVREEYDTHWNELKKVNDELRILTGGINPKSSKQVGEFLYDKLGFSVPRDYAGNEILTEAGRRPTDANTLLRLHASTREQSAFLALKKRQSVLDAAVSKNLEFFLGVCRARGGHFKGIYNQAVTRTHRLSSSGVPLQLEGWPKPKGVQLQNLDRDFKRLFTVAKGRDNLLAEVDGAQLEFRVAAFLGQDPQGIRDIKQGYDIHAFTASILHGISEDRVSKAQRQDAKEHTFKPLYGGSSGTPRERAYYEAFREKYSELEDTQKGWTYEVLEHKKLRLPWGMEFFWPDTRIEGNNGYITNKQSIYNYPVQSFATAEIIPIAVTYLWHEMKAHGMKSFLVNTVHDSAIAEIFPEERELFEELAVQCFTHRVFNYLETVYDIDFNVPLGVEIKMGSHWGEGKGKKVDVEKAR